ncbi:MAG: phosphoribosylformylglycinamidine cyclo-ligase [Candidatus Omnitrophota bacterium]
MAKAMTYKKAGVNITEANKFVDNIKPLVKATHRNGVLNDIGGFGGCFGLALTKYKNPVLVSSADGVGTKLKIAIQANKHDTVGFDLVAMNVNDILAMGAEPLFFLDYISTGKLDNSKLVTIVRGICRGCKEAGCALIGGETAEMPALYAKEEYDLAGFCVGIAEKNKIITGKTIKPEDILIGVASSGLHSNGFSLVNKVFSKQEIKSRAKELLVPTRIYVKPVISLLKKINVRGIAHITGGAFYEKLMRIFPVNTAVIINKKSWSVPKIFKEIKKRANINDPEMYRTFNMGIGLVLVVSPEDAKTTLNHLKKFKIKSQIIGKVIKGNGDIKFIN